MTEPDIVVLNAMVNAVESDIAAHASAITSLTTRISYGEYTVTDGVTRILDLEKQNGKLRHELDLLHKKVDELEAALRGVDDRIAERVRVLLDAQF